MIGLGEIPVKDGASIVESRNKIRLLAEDLKFDSISATRLATITSELIRKMIKSGQYSCINVELGRKNGAFGLILRFTSEQIASALSAEAMEAVFDNVKTYRTEDDLECIEMFKALPDPEFELSKDFIQTEKEMLMRPSRAELLNELRAKNEDLNKLLDELKVRADKEKKLATAAAAAAAEKLRADELEKAKEQMWRKSAVVEAINKVFQETLVCETEEQVAYTCINMAEELTGSKYGLIGEVNEAGRFDTISYGDLGWAICKIPESQAISLSKNMELRGIWAQAILKEKSQIVNNPASHPDRVGVPEGHPAITSFLGVPLQHAGKTIGMIGLANKEGGYEPADQEAVESLSVAFVEALRRKRTEEALQKSYEELGRAHRQLEESQAQLVQTEKMVAVGTLVAGVAHELNNPMMGIINFTQYCLKHTSKDDKRYAVLQNTEREVKRCIAVVENLLTFSHLEKEGEEGFQKASCADILERVFKLLSYRIEKERVKVTKHYAKDTPEVWIKTNSIQQVFLNFVGNAIDALKDCEKKEIHIYVQRQGEFVQVTIADTGAGIAPENVDKIFEPFFTTKPVDKGTGLGLSISHSIIEAHVGKLTCESKPGEGAKFRILLPMEQKK